MRQIGNLRHPGGDNQGHFQGTGSILAGKRNIRIRRPVERLDSLGHCQRQAWSIQDIEPTCESQNEGPRISRLKSRWSGHDSVSIDRVRDGSSAFSTRGNECFKAGLRCQAARNFCHWKLKDFCISLHRGPELPGFRADPFYLDRCAAGA